MKSNFLSYYKKDEANPHRLFLDSDVTLTSEGAETALFHIANTASQAQLDDFTKTIGISLVGEENLLLDGCGHTITAQCRMIYLALFGCKKIRIVNTVFHTERPTVSEFTVRSRSGRSALVEIAPGCTYRIKEGELSFYGPEGDYYDGANNFLACQIYDPKTNTTRRTPRPFHFKKGTKGAPNAEELSPNLVKLTYRFRPPFRAGVTVQLRNTVRKGVGFYFERSEEISMENVAVHETHGLGVVGQLSRDISLNSCRFLPSEGRTTVAFADFVHMIGCGGKIEVRRCIFDGAHDDVLNVHGIHFPVLAFPARNAARVRFAHPETFGFSYFDVGDRFELIDRATLLPVAEGEISSLELLSPYEILLGFSAPLSVDPGKDYAIEDVSKNSADVSFCGNKIYNIPTRGVLLTNGGRAEVKDNLFYKTGMSAVLIADDANSWYESGRLKEALIENNLFVECASPVICVRPEIKRFGGNVHGKIIVRGNSYTLSRGKFLSARACEPIASDNKRYDREEDFPQ